MRLAKLASAVIGMGALTAVVLVPHSCARFPNFGPLPVGATISLRPVAVNSLASAQPEIEDLGSVHLTILWEGSPLSLNDARATVRFYRKADLQKPFYAASWADLLDAWKAGCPDEQVELLHGPTPAALICDGRLGRLTDLGKIEIVSPEEKETKAVTAFSHYPKAHDVQAIVVNVY